LRKTCLSSRDLRLGRRFTFQQDNDPKHTAQATLKWFKGKHLNVLEWPSQSSDLNPIDNLWCDIKIAVHQWNPSNLKELEQFCLEEWAEIPVARCAKMIETVMHAPVLFLTCFTIKIFCIFKVVGMLCKSNETTPPQKIYICWFQLVRQQHRKNAKGVNTFASHCTSDKQLVILPNRAILELPVISMSLEQSQNQNSVRSRLLS
jgi:hypothetical protein